MDNLNYLRKLTFVTASTLMINGAVTAAPLLSEQESAETQVINSKQVNEQSSTVTPVANEQQSSDDGSNEVVSEQQTTETAAVTSGNKRTVVNLESTIVGDKEQPKVLSIVPWQTPEQAAVMSKPVTRQIQMTFKPIEAESLGRELKYYKKSKQ